MWIFPVPDEDFTIEKGEGIMKEYEFGKRRIIHLVNASYSSRETNI
jgi:hypothetical protein